MAKFYITTSIAYTNAPPHGGFALELAQADVLARYHRILGDDVFFLTGTDEHGLKIARKAKQEGKETQDFVDEIASQFKSLKPALNLSNDDFIRTTDKKRHWPSVQAVWKKLEKNEDIYKKKYKGLYCVGCETFLTEKELVGGKCGIHKTRPEEFEEENYFFRLSKYASGVEKILREEKIKITPVKRVKELLELIRRGAEDVSCSRSREKVEWGIPVPGDDDQIIYVWFEALINYISALGYVKDSGKFKKLWPADVHCIGKDIFRFHGLLWPAMLLSLGLKLPKAILIHGFISFGGQKMSKSLGNVIDPFWLVEKYGADAVRYYLLREIPSTEDGDFTLERLEERYNAELASGVGNLVSRVNAMALDRGWNVDYSADIEKDLKKEIEKAKSRYKKTLDEFLFHETLKSIWDLMSFCDRFIEKEKPWEKKDGSEKAVYSLLFALKEIADMLSPFLPDAAGKILKQLGPKSVGGGRVSFLVKKGESLFPRIDNKSNL